jgi:hypothetical protein
MDHHEIRQIHGKWEQKWALDDFRFQVSSLIPPNVPIVNKDVPAWDRCNSIFM